MRHQGLLEDKGCHFRIWLIMNQSIQRRIKCKASSQNNLCKCLQLQAKANTIKKLAVGAMTREELDAELQKGVDSIKAGKVYSADEVDAVLAKGIR